MLHHPSSKALLATTALALAPCLTAQGNLIAYPNSSTSETGRTVEAPFGFHVSSNQYDECRYQMLIPATHLPTVPCTLWSLGVITHGPSGLHRLESMRIAMAHTTSKTLPSMHFDSNLGTSPAVLTVGPNGAGFYSTTFKNGDWGEIVFPQAFNYNGKDGLVIDIQVRQDRSLNPLSGALEVQTSSSPTRSDLPFAISVSRGPSGGAAFPPVANKVHTSFMKLRLRMGFPAASTVGSLSVGSDVGGSVPATFPVGGKVKIDFNFTAPGRRFIVYADTGFIGPVSIPGFGGALRVTPNELWIGADTMAPGESLSANIPNLPSLVGQRITLQGISASQSLTELNFTNAVDFLINKG